MGKAEGKKGFLSPPLYAGDTPYHVFHSIRVGKFRSRYFYMEDVFVEIWYLILLNCYPVCGFVNRTPNPPDCMAHLRSV